MKLLLTLTLALAFAVSATHSMTLEARTDDHDISPDLCATNPCPADLKSELAKTEKEVEKAEAELAELEEKEEEEEEEGEQRQKRFLLTGLLFKKLILTKYLFPPTFQQFGK